MGPAPPAVPMLLDTDLGTNVDDALALAYAARHPGIDLRAVVTVSGDAGARAHLASALLHLAGRGDVLVAAGRGGFEARAWSGHEAEGMPAGWSTSAVSDRPGLDVLTAHDGVVVTLGMLTNVAAAVHAGRWRPRSLVVMGGLFPPTELPPDRDHNLVTDADGAVAALSCGAPVRYVPIDVTVRTGLLPHHLRALDSGDDLCRCLAGLVRAWRARVRVLRAQGRHDLGERVALLHDPLAVAAAVDDSFVRVERLPVTVVRTPGGVRTFVDPVAGTPADVVRDVDAAAFADHWLRVVLGG